MKAIKAVIKDGNVILAEPIRDKGEIEAVVVLLDDPWDPICQDNTPRPALAEACKEALAEFEAGETPPVQPDDMS